LDEFENLLKNKENIRTEFKTTPSLTDNEEIANQLTAFANRIGGNLIFGINNDGTYEGAKIDEDNLVLKISSIARDSCSPPVIFSHQLFPTNRGDALLIKVEKRKSIPHAVIERKNHEIKNRTYYLRTANGKRLVDDKTLEWLFKNTDDPRIYERFSFYLTYYRKTLGLPTIEFPSGIRYFISFFNALTDKDKAYLAEDGNRTGSFIVEIAPYVLLKHLSLLFRHSWQIEIVKYSDWGRWGPRSGARAGKTIRFADILPPNEKLVSKSLSINFHELLGNPYDEITVPQNSEIHIESKYGISSIEFFKKDAFSIKVEFMMAHWKTGLPQSHPLRYKYYRNDISPERQKSISEIIASQCVDVTFDANFAFPDIVDDLFTEYFEYGQTIHNHLQDEWNWDLFLKHLPHGKLYSIEDKIDEILQVLRGPASS
jgi:hypothetical protein